MVGKHDMKANYSNETSQPNLLAPEKLPPGEASLRAKGRRLVPGAGPGVASNRPAPANLTSRKDLFGIMQPTGPGKEDEIGLQDSWLGHTLVDPSKGKACPADACSGSDLTTLINQLAPGLPTADSWIGNRLIDPKKGKCSAPGPESMGARKDLFTVIQMQEDAPREEGAPAPKDKVVDSWIGNQLIDPTKGKRHLPPPSNVKGRKDLFGVMQMRGPPAGESVPVGRKVSEGAAGTAARELLHNHDLKPLAPVGGRKVDPSSRAEGVGGWKFFTGATKHKMQEKRVAHRDVPGSTGILRGPTAGHGPGLLMFDANYGKEIATFE